MSDTESRVKQVIVEQLGVDIEKLKSETSLVADLGADSLDNVELVMALEDEFSIQIDDDAAEACTTVAQIVILVKNTLKTPKTA